MVIPPPVLWKLAAASGPWIKLAGLSGATAVMLGAYGAHSTLSIIMIDYIYHFNNFTIKNLSFYRRLW